MQIALNNNLFTHQSIDLISIFKGFLASVLDNYKTKHQTYDLEKRVKTIRNNVRILNDNLEELVKYKEFEKLEDELLDLKFFIETLLNTNLPANLKNELNLLYEDLVTFNFNSSMLEMGQEVEKNCKNYLFKCEELDDLI